MAYTAKVKCTYDADSIVFKKGEVYEIENGVMKGRERQFRTPIESLGELNEISLATFVEVVE